MSSQPSSQQNGYQHAESSRAGASNAYPGPPSGQHGDRYHPMTTPSLPPQVQQYRRESLTNGGTSYRDGRMENWDSDQTPGADFTSLPQVDDINGHASSSRASTVVGRTLGGDRPRDREITIREIRTISMPMDVDGAAGDGIGRVRIPIPPVQTIVSCKLDDREGEVFEGRNSEDRSGALLLLTLHVYLFG